MPSLTREEAQALTRKAERPKIAPVARRKASPKERAIQAAILEYLGTVPGVMAWKSGAGMFPMTYRGKTRMVRMGKPGVSDIVGFVRKRVEVFVNGAWGPTAMDGKPAPVAQFLAIEVKRPKHYPTPEQAAFLTAVERAGGIAIVARCVADVAERLHGPSEAR